MIPRKVDWSELFDPELLEENGNLKVDPASLDQVVLEVVDDAKRDPHQLARCRDPGELANVRPHKIGLEYGLTIIHNEILCLCPRIEGNMIHVVQHLGDSFRAFMQVAGCHVGEDNIVRHHAEVRMVGAQIARYDLSCAFNRHWS